MSSLVNYINHNNIVIIEFNNPPVNSLGQGLRSAIMHTLDRAVSDPAIEAIVFASRGKAFCAGADISEFGTDKALITPNLSNLCHALQNSSKLIVAAINGEALGGGFELALACNHLIASPHALFGFSEAQLGLFPKLCNTQQISGLADSKAVVETVTSGNLVSAQQMEQAGIIDCIANPKLCFVGQAINFAEELLDTNRHLSHNYIGMNTEVDRKTCAFSLCQQVTEAAYNPLLVEGLNEKI